MEDLTYAASNLVDSLERFLGEREMPARKTLPLLLCALATFAASAGAADTEVVIRAEDDFPLVARYFTSGEPGPGALLLHQCDREEGAETGYAPLVAALRSRGFSVLELDSRGYGKSVSDEFTRASWKKAVPYETSDSIQALHFLVTRREIVGHPVVIIGASCGGRRGVRAAASFEQVSAFVFLSSGLGPSEREMIQALRLPTYCIAAENDPHGTTTDSMRAVHESSRDGRSRIEIFEGALHGAPLFDQEPELPSRIAAWAASITEPASSSSSRERGHRF